MENPQTKNLETIVRGLLAGCSKKKEPIDVVVNRIYSRLLSKGIVGPNHAGVRIFLRVGFIGKHRVRTEDKIRIVIHALKTAKVDLTRFGMRPPPQERILRKGEWNLRLSP